MLRLQIDVITSALNWRWQLLDDTGAVLARHDVALTAADLASTQLGDLYRSSLWRLDSDPQWRARSEHAILDPVGDFIGERLLGDIAEVVAQRAPTTVLVAIDTIAAPILGYPLELARHAGVALADAGVIWCYAPNTATRQPPPAPVAHPRVLALFALPVDSSALALVRERRELVRLMASLGASSQLTALQYGVTRDAVAHALGDPHGWDVIHLAGHGVAGAFYLENPDGSADFVDSDALVELLAPAAQRTRLIVLSACETGIARAARQGVPIRRADVTGRPSITTQNVGLHVAARLGCAVIAMRYPVSDDFSVAFTRGLYRGLLVDGTPLERVFHQAVESAVAEATHNPLARATPMLLTDAPDAPLTLAGTGVLTVDHVPLPGVPTDPPFFVGRSSALAAAAQILAPHSTSSAMAVIGMPGLGKTALLVEAAHIHSAQFDRIIWHQMDPDAALTTLCELLGVAVTEAGTAEVDAVRQQRVLIVIDDADLGTVDEEHWHATQLGEFLDRIAAPGGAARLLLASGRRLPLSQEIQQVALALLSTSEVDLLRRELAEHHGLTGLPATAPVGTVCRGHPGLIIDLYSVAPEQIWPMTLRLGRLWDVPTPLSPASAAARQPLAADHLGSKIVAWTQARLAELADSPRLLMLLVSAIEASDRRRSTLEVLWPMVIEQFVDQRQPEPAHGELDTAMASLLAAGLVAVMGGDFLVVQPAVASAARGIRAEIDQFAAETMAVWWQQFHKLDGEHGAGAEAMAHSAASAVPYLMRLGAWEQASTWTEIAIHTDTSPAMAARLRPYAAEIVATTAEQPEVQRAARYVMATVVGVVDHGQGLAAMIELYGDAEKCDHATVIVGAAAAIADAMSPTSPQQAHRWLQEAITRHDAHPVNPLVSIMLRLKAAKLAADVGSDAQTSLAAARALAEELEELIGNGTPLYGVHLPGLRSEIAEFVLTMMRRAAAAPHPQPALLSELDDSETASQRDIVRAQFNHLATTNTGELADHAAEELLAAMLAEYPGSSDPANFALVLGVLAEIRWHVGSVTEGIELTRRALRSDYTAMASLQAARDHRQLAVMLAAAGQRDQAAAHLLASAIIYLRISEGLFAIVGDHRLDGAIWTVKMLLARAPEFVPPSYAELRRGLAGEIGADIEDLLQGAPHLPMTVDDHTGQITIDWQTAPADTSLADVVALASVNPGPAELTDPSQVGRHWSELIDLVADAARCRADANPVLGIVAAAGWTHLATALRLVAAGGTETTVTGLDTAEERIVADSIARAAMGTSGA